MDNNDELKEIQKQLEDLKREVLNKKEAEKKGRLTRRGRKKSRNPMDTTILIYIQKPDKENFYNICDKKNISASELLREWILDYIEKNGN